ncbi:MAG: hypothetical protein H6807_09375 [Planctomycetes bacterium]|nr:hypothetical protein [Planctomycetota bacterium]
MTPAPRQPDRAAHLRRGRGLPLVLILLLLGLAGARPVAAQGRPDPDADRKEDEANEARLVADEETKALDQAMKLPKLAHLRTRNFFLHYDIERLKVGQRYYDKEQGAFLYSRRLEELLRDWQATFGKPRTFPRCGYYEIWILATANDTARVQATLMGGASKLHSSEKPIFVTGLDKDALLDDDALHANVYHHASHLITQQGFPYDKAEYPGWWAVGIAHWLEIKKFGETRNFTTGEVSSKKDRWQMGKWPKKVASAARKEDEPKLATFCDRDAKKLNAMLAAFSWSFVDYLVAEHPDKLNQLAHALSSGKSTADCFREILGWSLSRFQDEWRAECVKKMGQITPAPKIR